MKKLYENEPYLLNFTAKVTNAINIKGETWICLNQTAFFPESGGQQADLGVINESKVIDVQLIDNLIYHKISSPIPIGTVVEGSVDKERRLYGMQNHTGEHIVSGIIHRLYGLDNVGFHLGESVTLDINGVLNNEQIKEVEQISNQAIYDNVPIVITYPTKEEQYHIDCRSKIDFNSVESLRIVTIGEYDCCACCAPHLSHTGEIGIIKIIDAFPYKKGTRITILCGKSALNDYIKKHDINLNIMHYLSTTAYHTDEGVSKILSMLSNAKQEIKALKEQVCIEKIKTAVKFERFTYLLLDNASFDDMRFCANILLEKSKFCLILSYIDESKIEANYLIASENKFTPNEVKEFNLKFHGRGGGNGNMAQGKLSCPLEDIILELNQK